MAGEFQAALPGLTTKKLRAVLWNVAGLVYNTSLSAFQAWSDGSVGDYEITMTEQGTSGHFIGSMPAVAAGLYQYEVRYPADQADPVVLIPTDPVVWTGELAWNGTAVVGASTILTTGGSGPWGGSSGSGAVTWVYTVTDGSNPIPDVFVWVTAENSSTVLASGYTDEAGEVTFYLDAGSYDFYSRKGGWNFTNPDPETVA